MGIQVKRGNGVYGGDGVTARYRPEGQGYDKQMNSINVREKKEYYDLEGTRLDLMKGLSKMNTRKL